MNIIVIHIVNVIAVNNFMLWSLLRL